MSTEGMGYLRFDCTHGRCNEGKQLHKKGKQWKIMLTHTGRNGADPRHFTVWKFASKPAGM